MKISDISAASLAVLLLAPAGLGAQPTLQKIGSVQIPLLGLTDVRVELWELTVERNIRGQARIVVRLSNGETPSDADSAALFKGRRIAAELSGPGLAETLMLSEKVTSRLALKIPALSVKGTYQLSNIRIVDEDDTGMEVSPGCLTVKVIDPVSSSVQPGSVR